jgi:SnoaL-like domain
MGRDLIDRSVALVDAGDAKGFSQLFTTDARVTFGNSEPLIGPKAIEEGGRAFLDSVAGISHQVVCAWTVSNDHIIEMAVTYRRHDGGVVTVPVVSIFHATDDALIDDYRVFFDLTPVYS